MAKNLFSVPIFFIVFRECLEASLIIAILLGLVEQIVHTGKVSAGPSESTTLSRHGNSADSPIDEKSKDPLAVTGEPLDDASVSDDEQLIRNKKLIRKLRIHVNHHLRSSTAT